MSDNLIEQPLTPKRKIIRLAGFLLLLVILPAVSWYYLQSGLEWRKEAKKELADYGKIRPAYIIYNDGERRDQLDSKISVVHIFGENPDLTPENKQILDVGEKLFTQFGKNTNFKLGMIAQGGNAEFKSYAQTLPSADYATWVWTGGLGSWRTIIENGYEKYCLDQNVKPVSHYFALTDTAGTILRFYNAMDEKEVGRMVEHIAMILPPDIQ